MAWRRPWRAGALSGRVALPILLALSGTAAAVAQPAGAPGVTGARPAADTTATVAATGQVSQSGSHQHAAPADAAAPALPPVTDEMRASAFPDVDGHALPDESTNWLLLVDQMEWESGSPRGNLGWDAKGWIGRDRTRLWFRTEGHRDGGRLADAQSHVFAGWQVARWWDVLVGVRQDFRPGPAQTWLAAGIQGLAPYWFDVEATAYLGAAGRSHVRLEASGDLLLTNRLILQPQTEVEIYGRDDLEHFRAAGLATLDLGIRLRYLIRREFAPYLGIVWHQKHGGTAAMARAGGEPVGGARLVAGVRAWR